MTMWPASLIMESFEPVMVEWKNWEYLTGVSLSLSPTIIKVGTLT
jgi:hypothetical protein